MSEQTAAGFAIEAIAVTAKNKAISLDDAARWFAARWPAKALETMEGLGSWPSSERELAALQRVWS